jgi:transcriptional regulator with XRE-family HTH domain
MQLRAMRDRAGLTQTELGQKVGMNQNAISRLERLDYGKASLTTLKRLAAAFDVGLMVYFVPFGKMADWVSGTPYLENGLNPDAIDVPNYERERDEKDVAIPSTAQAFAASGGMIHPDVKTTNFVTVHVVRDLLGSYSRISDELKTTPLPVVGGFNKEKGDLENASRRVS